MKKSILIILDGFGESKAIKYNAIALADTPNLDYYKQNFLYTQLQASSAYVGLPTGIFGNSEVGHLNIGAGRIISQVINHIDADIADKKFFKHQRLLSVLSNCNHNQCHIMGLLSNGAVHAMNTHYYAMIELISNYATINHNIDNIWLHLFLDGRDTALNSALNFIKELEEFISNLTQTQQDKIKIATVSGRYYAMDRDNRYQRTSLAYFAIAEAQSSNLSMDISQNKILNATDYVELCYAQGVFDEFIPPYVCVEDYHGLKLHDSVFITNFRADRAIQLTSALAKKDFIGFDRQYIDLDIITMTQYQANLPVTVLYEKDRVTNSLGECIAKVGGKQLRIAETEKYPHVTYFFSGGVDHPYQGEERIFIPSAQNITSYDQQPEMSLPQLSEQLMTAISSQTYQLIVANFANGDMVGHTGNLPATIKAVASIDHYLSLVVDLALANDYHIIITADHGNCELMYDQTNQLPHTQHTTNLVPFICITNNQLKLKFTNNKIKECDNIAGGALQDIAPTILYLLDINKPVEMTGHSLLEYEK